MTLINWVYIQKVRFIKKGYLREKCLLCLIHCVFYFSEIVLIDFPALTVNKTLVSKQSWAFK